MYIPISNPQGWRCIYFFVFSHANINQRLVKPGLAGAEKTTSTMFESPGMHQKVPTLLLGAQQRNWFVSRPFSVRKK
jgi:hypothetical protein